MGIVHINWYATGFRATMLARAGRLAPLALRSSARLAGHPFRDVHDDLVVTAQPDRLPARAAVRGGQLCSSAPDGRLA